MSELVKTSGDKEHSKYSASGSSRWLNCPGSIRLSESAPPEAESDAAKEGTEAHKCLEFLLKNRVNLKAAVKVAAKTWDEDMIEHAKSAADWAIDQMNASPGAELLCETEINSSPFTCEGQFGTLDIGIARPFGRLTIADFKYGAGIVVDPAGYDGKGNSQLCYYALGLSYLYDHNFSEVELVVIQPRAYHESGETVRSFVMSMQELLEWGETFKVGVKVCESVSEHWVEPANLNLLSAGEWCRFCPAAVICPELSEKAFKEAQIDFSKEMALEAVPEPRMIQIPSLGRILDACDRLDDWITKVRAHAIHVLESGEKIDGYKLVQKKSQRRWSDIEGAEKDAGIQFGKMAFTEPKLLSPAQLEKAAKGHKGLDQWIKDRITNTSSGTTIAKSTDKRPEIETDFDFGPVPEEEYATTIPAKIKIKRKKK